MDIQYTTEVSGYQRKDAVTAICFWIVLMALYFAAAELGGAVTTAVIIILPISCILIALIKKQGISSLGFRRQNLRASLGVGLLCGITAVVLNKGILFALLYGWELQPAGYLAYRLAYLVVAVALAEEVIFRGYIQTRLYGIFQHDAFAVFAGALMFALMHAPFRMIGGDIATLIISIITTFVWHIVFNLLYRRYNSIYGPVLFHALMNWSNDLFAGQSLPWWSGYVFLLAAVFVLAVIGMRAIHARRRAK